MKSWKMHQESFENLNQTKFSQHWRKRGIHLIDSNLLSKVREEEKKKNNPENFE